MGTKVETLKRLRQLKWEHDESLVGDPNDGYIQDEQNTRNSYQLVAESAIREEVLTEADLEEAGLPLRLE
jgi:hypothetical protein